MPVRTFDGVDDQITTALGSLGFAFGPGTIAAVVRRTADSGVFEVIIKAGTSTVTGAYRLQIETSHRLALVCGTTVASSPSVLVNAADGWCLVAASKATGSVLARLHKCVLSTGVWTHANASANVGNSGTPSTSARIGATQAASGFFAGDIGILAVSNVVLNDAAIEALASGEAAWSSAGFVALWPPSEFGDMSTLQDVVGGADETSITGTSVTAVTIPWIVVESHSGSSSVSGGGDIITQGYKGGASSSTASGGGAVTESGFKGGTSSSSASAAGDVTESGFKGGLSNSTATAVASVVSLGIKGASTLSSVSGGGSPLSVGFKGALDSSSTSGGGTVVTLGFGTEPDRAAGSSSVSGGGSTPSSGFKGAISDSDVSATASIDTLSFKSGFGASTVTAKCSVTTQYVRQKPLDYSRPLWRCPSGDGGMMYPEVGDLVEGVVGPPSANPGLGVGGGGIAAGRIVRSRCEYGDVVLEQRLF